MKISIIVPCFNIECFIPDLFKQLESQKFQDFEVIFIDDCSTDKTKELLETYCKKHSNYHLIVNATNLGAGISRNKALKIAKAKVISCIDADDVIPDNYYKELYQTMTKYKSDIVVCDISLAYENNTSGIKDQYFKMQKDKNFLVTHPFAAAAWNKLIKKELLLNNPFGENIINEDISAIIGVQLLTDKISVTNNTYYTYIQRKYSVQNSPFNENKFDVFKALKIVENKFKDNIEYQNNREKILYEQLIIFFFQMLVKHNKWIERYHYLKRYQKEASIFELIKNKEIISHKNDSLEQKLFYPIFKLTMKHHFFLANCYISMLNKAIKIKNKVRKRVVKKNHSIDDLILLARTNQQLESPIGISVVIPNYNYDRYLLGRLDSILKQKVKLKEIIILDDCSTDLSRRTIKQVEKKLNSIIPIKVIFNKTNTGSPFAQWKLGINKAEGDYIWIAEADDYSHIDFLSSIVEPLKSDKDIVLSYADSKYINGKGNVLMPSVRSLIDLRKTGHWNNSYINDGKKELNDYLFLNCTIANVSSCLIKKGDYDSIFKDTIGFKQAGDWIFYVNLALQGKIAYHNKPLNYCRMHGSNISSVYDKEKHLNEIISIHKYINKKIKMGNWQKKEIEKRYKTLRTIWKLD